ncbi:MAG: DUF5343 domain-containing protein [Thaumarchaeota archaeon]|nr:DUF5343 domain-containing protein [Nitrososphaerota archaeon]
MEGEEKKNESVCTIPIGVEIRKWKLLVRALKQLGANEKPVSSEQLAKLTGIYENNVAINIKFLRQLEFITADSKPKVINLSPTGIEFTNALIMADEEKQKQMLSTAFKEKFKDIISFYELHKQNQDLNFEMLFNQIKLLSNSPDVTDQLGNTHSMYRTGIHTLINLLIFSEIIDEKYNPEKNSATILKEKSRQPRIRSEVPLRCSIDWIKKLFQEVRDMNPQTIPKEFITANVVKNNNESKILSVARFIGLIDKEGNRAENYEKLRLFGDDEFQENLEQIIKEKYNKIFSIANITTVERNNLEIVFMKEYDLGKDQAHNAVITFVHLCQLSNTDISPSLISSKTSTQTKTKLPQIKKIQNNENQIQPAPIIPYVIPDSPFKINLNINLEIKDKEDLHEVINLIRDLKKETQPSLPQLDITVSEDPETQSS